MAKKKKNKSKSLYTNAQVKKMARAYRDGKRTHYGYILALPWWTRLKVAYCLFVGRVCQY